MSNQKPTGHNSGKPEDDFMANPRSIPDQSPVRKILFSLQRGNFGMGDHLITVSHLRLEIVEYFLARICLQNPHGFIINITYMLGIAVSNARHTLHISLLA